MGRGQLRLPLIVEKEEWFGVAKSSWAWQRRFKPIWKRLESGGTVPPRLQRDAGMVQLEKLLALETVQDMKSHWFARPELKRERDWRYVMLAAMNFHADTVPQVLEATVEARVTPYWAVADIFGFLVKRASILPDHLQKQHQAAIPPLLLHVLRNSSAGDFRLHQWVLGHIMSTSDADTAAEMYSALRQYNHPLHFNTKFKIAERLMTDEKYRMLVLQILEGLATDDGLHIGDRRCAALATALVKLPADWKEGRCSPVEVEAVVQVFERVVALGHSPNLITYTAMIRTLCLTNQLDTAFGIYKIMCEQGMTPDSHLCATLLDGARRAGSLESAIRVVEDASRAIVRSPFVASNLLFTVLTAGRHEVKGGSQPLNTIPVFTPMLRVYSKLYKLESLQTLIPVDLRARIADGVPEDKVLESSHFLDAASRLMDKLPWIPERRKLEPSLDTLGIMLVGYLRGSLTWRSLHDFYQHFQRLLEKLDPVAVAVANHSTLPYDALIKALTHNFHLVGQAVSIVDNMIANAGKRKQPTDWTPRPVAPDPYAPIAEQPAGPETPRLNPPPPSVYTWTILIGAMLHKKLHHKARQTLFDMYENGVEPNVITFNTFVADHARYQEWRRVLDYANRLEKAGFHPNQRTFAGMAGLYDPGPVLDWADRRANLRATERWRELDRVVALSGLAIPDEEDPEKLRLLLEEEEYQKAADAAAAASEANRVAARQKNPDDAGKVWQPDEFVHAVADPALAAATAVQGRKKMLQTAEVGAYMELYDELLFGGAAPAGPVAEVQAEVSRYEGVFDDVDEEFRGRPVGERLAGGAFPRAEPDPFAQIVEQRESFKRVGRGASPDPFVPVRGEILGRAGPGVSPDPFLPVKGPEKPFERVGQAASPDPLVPVGQREPFKQAGQEVSLPSSTRKPKEPFGWAGLGVPPEDSFMPVREPEEPFGRTGPAASPDPFVPVQEQPLRWRRRRDDQEIPEPLPIPLRQIARRQEPRGQGGGQDPGRQDRDRDRPPAAAEEAPETEEPVPLRARGGE